MTASIAERRCWFEAVRPRQCATFAHPIRDCIVASVCLEAALLACRILQRTYKEGLWEQVDVPLRSVAPGRHKKREEKT